MSLLTFITIASVSPMKLSKVIVLSPQNCTVTSYGIYIEPDGTETNVSCTRTASSCNEARAQATDCRNQNICARVIANGYTPPSNLGCKTDVLVGP